MDCSKIDRISDHLRSELKRVLKHRELLQQQNPDAIPLQDAIVEKELIDNDLPNAMELLQRTLQRKDLRGEVVAALKRLESACNDALALAPNLTKATVQ